MAFGSGGIRGHPRDRGFRLRKGLLVGSKDPARVTIERKPFAHVLSIPTVFLKSERAIFAHEDINAAVAGRTVEGGYDPSAHGDPRDKANVN